MRGGEGRACVYGTFTLWSYYLSVINIAWDKREW